MLILKVNKIQQLIAKYRCKVIKIVLKSLFGNTCRQKHATHSKQSIGLQRNSIKWFLCDVSDY